MENKALKRTLEDYEKMHRLGLPEPNDVKRMVELISNIEMLLREYREGN